MKHAKTLLVGETRSRWRAAKVLVLICSTVACADAPPAPDLPLSAAAAGRSSLMPVPTAASAVPAAGGAKVGGSGSAGGPRAPSALSAAGAGAGAPGGAGAADPASGSTCTEPFTVAQRVNVDMSWQETLGFYGGTGRLQLWQKLRYTPTLEGYVTEAVPCGIVLPVVDTTPLLDGIRLSNEIPAGSFELPSMPRVAGRAPCQTAQLVLDVGESVLGTELTDPTLPWPERMAIALADHDADGKPGVTALPKHDAGFGLPPVDIGQTRFADQIYIASRVALRLQSTQAGCTSNLEGELEPLRFDYTIVGCHAQDRGDCTASEVNLLDNNSPVFTLGDQGRWSSVPIPESATCAQVLAALPSE